MVWLGRPLWAGTVGPQDMHNESLTKFETDWNSLGCEVSEQLLLDTSSKLISLGLRDLGYNYVVLDDCWSDGRDEKGKIKVDLDRFPHGMKWVAEQMHSRNLLYGMYSSSGEMTCARYEGSLDHEQDDAESWASWDVDYLKVGDTYIWRSAMCLLT